MTLENDRTDHNRLAEQFAARLREQVSEPAAPKKSRRARLTTVSTTDAPAAATQVVSENPRTTSKIEILTCEQNSPEWFRARMGIPTASCFSDVLAKGEGKTRRAYMLKLAGELLTGQPMEVVTNLHMERGKEMEAEARDLYALQTGAACERIGFLKNGRAGCSPDSLIGDDGGLEIKTKLPHLLIDVILKDEFPAEHKAQVQGTLWLTGRKWWDLAVYWPGLPLFVKRVERDEAYITQLATEVDRFNTDLDAIVSQVRARIDRETDGIAFASVAA